MAEATDPPRPSRPSIVVMMIGWFLACALALTLFFIDTLTPQASL